MYIYDLEITMARKNIPLTEKLVATIKEAIDIANNSFSAIRYQRTIEFINQIDDYKIHIRMCSKDPINPTRSISSLSRALVKNECEKKSDILNEYIYNGSVFISKLIGENHKVSTYISETEMVREIISMAFDQKTMNNRDKDLSNKCIHDIKDIVLYYINNKTEHL